MADELPGNIDLNWIGRTLLNMQEEMRRDFAQLRGDVAELRGDVSELRGGIAELRRFRAEDRSLLEDVAMELGREPTKAQLSRERFQLETNARLDRLETKVCPSAE